VVVAYAFEDHFSIVETATVAPVAPPNDNASLVVPHPAKPNLAMFRAVVVAYAVSV